MLKRICVAIGVAVLLGGTAGRAWSALPSAANLMTFEDVDGQRYFALSVQPTGALPAAPSRDVLILVDTSASQTGAYRDDSIQALQTVLQGLRPEDRVQLAAVDLRMVPLSDGFAAASSPNTQSAVKQLQQRAPLGSTDLVQGLASAAAAFDRDAQVPRHIVYLGDGISHADVPSPEQFAQLVRQLTDRRVTFSSYAIGPARDVHLLAALANQTGGQVYIDADRVSGQQAGAALLKSLDSAVVWPTTERLDDAIQESYPRRMPPLRADRDSILIGVLRQGAKLTAVQLEGQANGQPVQLQGTIESQAPSDDYSFLPQLVEMARRDEGVSLPTLGTPALREIRRLMVAGADDLSRLGNQALMSGNLAGAKLLAEEALRRDPSSPQAAALRNVVDKKAEQKTLLVQDQPALRLVPEEVPQPAAPSEPFLQEFVQTEGASGLLDQATQERRLNNEIIRSEVNQTLAAAREQVRTDPNTAIIDLKTLREAVRQAPDLDADVRAQLLDRIDNALRQSNQRKIEKDERDRMLRANRAQSLERQRLLELARRDDELIATYIQQFNSRLDERRFALAVDVVATAFEADPSLVVTNVALEKGAKHSPTTR